VSKDMEPEVQGTTMGDLERRGGERSEAARSGGSLIVGRQSLDSVRENPDPEVVEKAKRRRFGAEYRLKVLREADACKAPGELGALLRRQGLYSSLLVTWRRQREAGALREMRNRKRGPKPRPVDPRVKELEKENARLLRKLKQADTIMAVQKKVAEILGIPLKTLEEDEND